MKANFTTRIASYKKWEVSLGIFFCIVGLLGVIELIWDIQFLIYIHPSFVPLQLNSSIGLILCGLGFFSLPFSRHLSCIFSLLIFIFAFLFFIEFLFNIQIGIDEFLTKGAYVIDASHPGRTSATTALSLIIIAIGICLLSLPKKIFFSPSLFVLGIILLALNTLGLLSYAINFLGISSKSLLTPVSLQPAIVFLMAGCRFLYISLKECKELSSPTFSLPNIMLQLVGILLAVLMANILSYKQSGVIKKAVEEETLYTKNIIQGRVDFISKALYRLTSRLEDGDEEDWKREWLLYARDFSFLHSFIFLDTNLNASTFSDTKIDPSLKENGFRFLKIN